MCGACETPQQLQVYWCRHTCTCLRLKIALIVNHVFHEMDKTKNTLTMINPREYAVAFFELCPVISALIMRAKKLVKKITRQPCLHDTVRLTVEFAETKNININVSALVLVF